MPRTAGRTGVATRFKLALSARTLASLKQAIETACNVPAARTARVARGRAAAAALLKGIRTRVVDDKAESVKVSVVRFDGHGVCHAFAPAPAPGSAPDPEMA